MYLYLYLINAWQISVLALENEKRKYSTILNDHTWPYVIHLCFVHCMLQIISGIFQNWLAHTIGEQQQKIGSKIGYCIYRISSICNISNETAYHVAVNLNFKKKSHGKLAGFYYEANNWYNSSNINREYRHCIATVKCFVCDVTVDINESRSVDKFVKTRTSTRQ